MKKYFCVICMLLATTSMMTSCLSSDSNYDTTTYDDAVITSFILGNLNQYGTTKEGKDTLYRNAITGSDYDLYIDQANNQVYNARLLPYKTDMSKVACTVSTLNNGAVYVESIENTDEYYLFSSTDSLDFTNGYRWMRVYASDGSVYRRYKVTLTAHPQSTDFSWTEIDPSDPTIPATIDHTVSLEKTASGFNLTYDEVTTEETLAEEEIASELPEKNLAMITWPLKSNADATYYLLVGTVDGVEACKVWRKIEVINKGVKTGQWVQLTLATGNKNFLPAMENISLLYFDDTVLAIGSDGYLYSSVDQGVNWRKDGRFIKPQEAGNHLSIVSEGNILWLKDLDANKVWRGIVYED